MLARRGCLRGLAAGSLARCVGARSPLHRSACSPPSIPLSSELRERVKTAPLAATYDPTVVEQGWQTYWQQTLRPSPQVESMATPPSNKVFSMILPPPNVTGALHLGHALTVTIQDAIARWHRMRGFDVRWLPGLDHAGIATQSVVERQLLKERGVSRHDLGREAFVQQVWRWNEQFGGRIMRQIDHLGAIVKRDQPYFTLDAQRSQAVVDAFVTLHDKGLVYRRRRMVNWCPTLQTAISDIEVDLEQLDKATRKTLPGRDKAVEFGVMHRFRYQVADGSAGEFLEVDTTRPETIFGDVAVAVHPEDERYEKYHGKFVIHPFSKERIPIVTDDVLVNMELGTGVVKVTPAHDPKDFECGRRHELPEVEVIDKYGKLCGNIDERFVGMDRFDARQRVVEELQAMGLYVDKLDHPTALSICSRSGDVIEPLLMPQWYVDCSAMAKRAADNVRNGVMTIEPKLHAHTWFFFLDNIQDWCVSRQLWWGHRIPAYRLKPGTIGVSDAKDQWFVASSLEEAREKAEAELGCKLQDDDLEQDVDVLDTWFSSGLLPLSAFGWPNASNDDAVTKDLNSSYPLDVMETGSDILFFWVARMAMLCEEFSGRVPFEKVLLHPMVRDKAGRKMSKSLGNVIDPLHVINGISLEQLLTDLQGGNVSPRELKKAEKELKKEFPKGIPTCGADALRFTLASYLQQGRQINMDVQRVVSYRHFCNKVWNAVRYALPLLEADTSAGTDKRADLSHMRDDMTLADRWIMSRLAGVVSEVNNGIAGNQLATSVAAIQRFFVQELCDVYIEFSKPVLYGNRLEQDVDFEEQRARKRSAQATLHRCLDYSMRLLHPFTPFVTEELWQRIRDADPLAASSRKQEVETSILCSEYPEEAHMSSWVDADAEERMALVIDVIHGIRSLRHTVKVLAPNATPAGDSGLPTIRIVCSNATVHSELKDAQRDLETQCRVNVDISVAGDGSSSPSSAHVLTHSVSDSCRVMLAVPDDAETTQRVASEISRLEKRASKSASAAEALIRRQQGPHYADKVPESVQAQDAQRLTQLQTDLHAAEKSLAALRELQQLY
ncbi:putative valine--tRNA ligase, cytoplasmic [Phytophthora rubi]|uniref:Valine--tRNA ligase, mitochondrial n=1 Tax=Phytophthora rubi TaxID=129364 RepID=A0A6A3ISS6_9STRA|nr:putative valine--tRNA ligase, cytoplasmic [Phytophthora rubi]KAE9292924.1 putative valine--tRNA ligase, cytoplasmic [Phytophthora rubi]